ncbi:hypothetical protein K8R61_00675 [bacterium]|nr:hypothetical protein [bacterium]
MKKNLLNLLIVIIVILGSYLLWIIFTQEWRGNDNLKYTNTKYGYRFQYSPEWNIMGDSQADILMLYNTENPPRDGGAPAGIKTEIMILENYDKLNLEDWVEQLSKRGPKQEVLQQENTTVSGIKAVRKTVSPTFVDLNEGDPISVYFMKENNVIVINYLGREPDYSAQLNNFELILKTFNFK